MGWNGNDVKPVVEPVSPQSTPKTRNRRVAVLILAAVAVAGLSLWYFSGNSNERSAAVVNREVNRPHTPIRHVTVPPADKPCLTNGEGKVVSLDSLPKTVTGEPYVEKAEITNSSGVVEVLYTLPDGSKKGATILQSRDTLVFDNDFDLMLAIIGTTPLDQALPPFPPGMETDFEKAFERAIETPIIVKDTDDEKVRAMKEAALNARMAIADLRREGYTVAQIIGEHNTLRDTNVKYRNDFQQELNRIWREQGEAAATTYMEMANPKLEEHGIIPLVMPGQGNSRKRKQENNQ